MVNLEESLGYAMSLLKLELQKKLKIQGYGDAQSSSLIRSIDPQIRTISNAIIGDMYMNDYYVFVEDGVSASSVPFSTPSGRGGTSKYIQGLVSFFMRKVGLGFKKALGASFATANKHKKEGIPLRSSKGFSSDGTRLNFIKSTLDEHLIGVEEILLREVGNEIELTFSAMLLSLSDEGFKIAA